MTHVPKDISQKVVQIRNEIIEHDKRYYVDEQPTISDVEYDLLMNQLKAYERLYPELITPNSPTQNVGSKSFYSRFPKAVHVRPMISLDNIYSDAEIRAWLQKTADALGISVDSLVWTGEPKLDGLALAIIFEDGVLIRGATRGRNGVGEDITPNVLTVAGIPHSLPIPFDKGQVEVRGEIFYTDADFAAFTEKMVRAGKKEPTSPRNSASGSLRQLDPSVTAERGLSFCVYSVLGEHDSLPDSHCERVALAKSWGFPVSEHLASGTGAQALVDATSAFYEIQKQIGFGTDGWVIKLDDIALQEQLGETARIPRWAIAHKPEAEEAFTVLTSIDIGVSRTGKLNPVGTYEPTLLGGVMNTTATLYNFDRIAERDYRVGDTIGLIRGGEVIPVAQYVDLERRPSNAIRVTPPSHCPVCDSPVEKVEAQHFCTGGLVCSAQAVDRIIYFGSKDCLNIFGLGDSTIELLFERDLIKLPSEIFALTMVDLCSLPKHTEVKAGKILKAIEAAKKTTLTRFLTALGIRGVGKESAAELANEFGSLDALQNTTSEKIEAIHGFSDASANSILTFFSNPQMQEEIDLLTSYIEISHQASASTALEGKSFVVTGSFDKVERKVIEATIKDNKGKVAGAVSKNTDYLIQGAGGGSKYEKAQKLIEKGEKIKILNEAQALELFDAEGIAIPQ